MRSARRYIKAAEKKFGAKLALLIVDTLSRYNDGEENSGSDMNAFLRAVDELRGDATSIVVHHTGHGNKAGDRSPWGCPYEPIRDAGQVKPTGEQILVNELSGAVAAVRPGIRSA